MLLHQLCHCPQQLFTRLDIVFDVCTMLVRQAHLDPSNAVVVPVPGVPLSLEHRGQLELVGDSVENVRGQDRFVEGQ